MPYKMQEAYIFQRHAGLLLLGFGVIAILFPATRSIMQLPSHLEWVLFAINTVMGVTLLRCRSRKLLDDLLLLAIACCAGSATAYTISLGINTASWVYVLEIFFLIDLLGRVRADQEHDQAGGGDD